MTSKEMLEEATRLAAAEMRAAAEKTKDKDPEASAHYSREASKAETALASLASFVPVVWQTTDGRYVVRLVEPTRFRAFRLPVGERRAAQSGLYETFAAAAGWCARDAEEQGEDSNERRRQR